MEAPFEFGTWLIDLVTPGMFSHEFAKNIYEHPYTREHILGFLPLSEDPETIMKHMSKLFGGNREMWHMVRGYISMMTHIADKEWSDKELIVGTMKNLFKNYSTTEDLKSSTVKTSFDHALKYCLTNYSTTLRDRPHNDVLAMVHICKTTYPEFEFNEKKILAMTSVVRQLMFLLNKHKKSEDMIKYVIDFDDYGHYVSHKKGLYGLIAQILWYDREGTYRSYKLQIALDKALNDKKFGKELQKVFNGDDFDETILECAYPEPHGDHFGEQTFGVWTAEGIDKHVCTQCGKSFDSDKERIAHLKEKLGNHFYNGHLSVRLAIKELGKDASEKDLFVLATQKLRKYYGQYAKFLHTKRCKNALLYFINKFKSV